MRRPGQRRPTNYEKTMADIREDARGAKAMGISLNAYEKTARDKREDARGQRRLDRQRQRK